MARPLAVLLALAASALFASSASADFTYQT
jgi:hypothetical protein